MGLSVQVLGPLRVHREGTPVHLTAQARAVLALLALGEGVPISSGQLIKALWPAAPPRTARDQVQNLIAALRRALGPRIPGGGRAARGSDSLITTEPVGYVLCLPSGQLDLEVFRATLAVARQCRAQGRLADALARYEKGLDLWSGVPCGDIDRPSVSDLAEPLTQVHADTVEEWAELAVAQGHGARVALRLRPVLAAHPFRERMQELLMRALCQAGRRPEALIVYQEGRRRLAEELGVDPSPSLQTLYRDLLQPA